MPMQDVFPGNYHNAIRADKLCGRKLGKIPAFRVWASMVSPSSPRSKIQNSTDVFGRCGEAGQVKGQNFIQRRRLQDSAGVMRQVFVDVTP
jgi:hypothetical protein